jgi:chromosome partitioning protein
MRSVALLNQKGGVGKTALTAGLAGGAAANGHSVLVVDLDPQGHLTDALKLPEATAPATLAAAMLGEYSGDPRTLCQPYSERLHVITTNLDMFLLPRQLYLAARGEDRLGRVLEGLVAHYDLCLIDCPPALDILTDNALVHAREVIVPVEAEDSSLKALRLLLGQIGSLEQQLQIQLDILGLMVNKIADASNITLSTLAAYEELPLPVLATIRKRTTVKEAWRAGQTVQDYAPDSDVAGWFRDVAKLLWG